MRIVRMNHVPVCNGPFDCFILVSITDGERGTAVPQSPIPIGRRTSTSARTGSCRTWPPWPSSALLARPPDRARKASVTAPVRVADLIDQLRITGTVLTYDPGTRTIRAGDEIAVAVTSGRRA
jgi:hypothetical protein